MNSTAHCNCCEFDASSAPFAWSSINTAQFFPNYTIFALSSLSNQFSSQVPSNFWYTYAGNSSERNDDHNGMLHIRLPSVDAWWARMHPCRTSCRICVLCLRSLLIHSTNLTFEACGLQNLAVCGATPLDAGKYAVDAVVVHLLNPQTSQHNDVYIWARLAIYRIVAIRKWGSLSACIAASENLWPSSGWLASLFLKKAVAMFCHSNMTVFCNC